MIALGVKHSCTLKTQVMQKVNDTRMEYMHFLSAAHVYYPDAFCNDAHRSASGNVVNSLG